jgi:glycosyltransferase involved in cell wall biosynthesis
LRISLVTPSLNQGRFLRRTLESVLGQRGAFEIEYLVIDGGSTDNTLSVLEEYRGRLDWLSGPDNGQVDAINRGLRMCTGDVVGWLNSDDVLLEGALQRAAEVFGAHEETEWVHGHCLILDEHDREIRRGVSWYKRMRCRRHSFDHLLAENYISQMTVLWRREISGEVGYLDPRFPLSFDYDLWLRLSQRSIPQYIEASQAGYRWYPASLSGAKFREQLREQWEVAAQYAQGRSRVLRRKRILTAAAMGTYTLLSWIPRSNRTRWPSLRRPGG